MRFQLDIPRPMSCSDGAVGMVVGKLKINICQIKITRLSPRGQAMMVPGLDDPVHPGAIREIPD